MHLRNRMQMQTGTIRSAVYRDVFTVNLHYFFRQEYRPFPALHVSLSTIRSTPGTDNELASLLRFLSLLPFSLPTLLIVTST